MANGFSDFLGSSAGKGAMFGAGAGVLKSLLSDQPKYQQQVASRSLEARFAPLLGQAVPSFSDIKRPDTTQAAIDWGLTGAVFGSQFGGKEGIKEGVKASEGNKILNAIQPANNHNQMAAFGAGMGPVSQQAALAMPINQQQPLIGSPGSGALFGENIYNPQLASFLSGVK